jgi:hypothetical protein
MPAASASGVTNAVQAAADNLVGYIALFYGDTDAMVAHALRRPVHSDEFTQFVCTEKTLSECTTLLMINADIRRVSYGADNVKKRTFFSVVFRVKLLNLFLVLYKAVDLVDFFLFCKFIESGHSISE